MYREQILHYAESNEYVKPAAGADISDIHRAEKEIGCAFPMDLHTLLLETNGDGYLIFSVDEIVETVARVRTMMAEYYEGLEMLLFFAGNGCGDYYCYKILPTGQADSSSIYIWLHEDNELAPVAHSLSELIDRYFNDEI